ncbi:uncharacterized protein [Penaeus vannamei]|uniref:uncharacterized protein n=1 Tax=Penaeus vannamei TaxID=6689 RepID=UPI00387FA170
MFFAVWTLIAVITCSHYARSSPVPPVVGALEPSSQDFAQGQDDAFASPDKRLLKYFLPESQALAAEEFAPMMATQEDTKRGYSNKNFVRFGRGDEKRGDRNFLRFGRGDAAMDKRNRNFLRFGRGPNRNYIRFGRSDLAPLEFGLGLPEEELPVIIDHGDIDEMFEAFKQEKKNARNSIRHRRSVDRQLSSFCDNCDDSQKPQQTTTAQPAAHPAAAVAAVTRPKRSEAEAKDALSLQRSKRYVVPNYYGYSSYSMNHSPAAWAKMIPAEDLELEEEPQVLSKRAFNVLSGPSEFVGSPSIPEGKMLVKQYPRIVRAPERNFLRFG